MTELLSPAGSYEQLVAAVRSGADAVYLGMGNFNARRNADNFIGQDFESAVAYSHRAGVKVYVTLNTLVKDSEIDELKSNLREIAEAGADGILVQDFAVYSIIKQCIPNIPVHASTQMAVHNVNGAKLLESLGFSRIVLARELSYNEIKTIKDSVSCEIEVFVHGAHCMSASGLCYMSSALGTRSGNRGLCAQPCRLDFKTDSRNFALSLKDMCLINEVKTLIDCGIDCIKIEGRMKRPEYVAAVTNAYRSAIDGKEYDVNSLKNVFSRSGFTDGYFKNQLSSEMFGIRTKEDVENMSSSLSSFRELYRTEPSKIPLELTFEAKNGKPMILTVSDGKHFCKVLSSVPQEAESKQATKDSVLNNLSKTGGTFYYIDKFDIVLDDGLFIPASVLNSMRRDCLSKLDEKREFENIYDFADINPGPVFPRSVNNKKPGIRCLFTDAGQVFDGGFNEIVLSYNQITQKHIDEYGDRLVASLPVLIYPGSEEETVTKLKLLKQSGLKFAIAENIGAVKMINDSGLLCKGGNRLNIINSVSADKYASLGVADITLSHEMSFDDVNNFNSRIPFGIIAYGYLPLMHFRCCPMKNGSSCNGCDGKNKLTDRMGKQFTVLCSQKKYSVLHNCIPLYVDYRSLPEADFYTLYFSNESKDECEEIYKSFISGKKLKGEKTMGLYNKTLQ